jgi:DNA (cytosine-5)-methyltransferase 1
MGRAAPVPTVGGRLNPSLVEWMMGLPAGWVTDVLPPNPALRCLGNGCLPLQAAAAFSHLLAPSLVSAGTSLGRKSLT